eukprot:328985-Chlamydomonas_euryale.AAC.1
MAFAPSLLLSLRAASRRAVASSATRLALRVHTTGDTPTRVAHVLKPRADLMPHVAHPFSPSPRHVTCVQPNNRRAVTRRDCRNLMCASWMRAAASVGHAAAWRRGRRKRA